jgi:hypothetical protein
MSEYNVEYEKKRRNDLKEIKKRINKPKKDKGMCSGCTENFYNGNNSLGVRECWSFSSAKVKLRKVVGLNDCPPWDWLPKYMLSCKRISRSVVMDGDRREWR